jgi:putative nucleotidyltransferase with HDIG domain
MQRIRVYTVAKDLGVSSKELMDFLSDSGTPVTSHFALIDGSIALSAREHFLGTETSELTEPAWATVATAERDEPVVPSFAPFEVEMPERAPKPVAVVEEAAADIHDIVPRHSLAFSAAATLGVAFIPTFAAFSTLVFGQPYPRPFLAVVMSILLTAGAIVLGSAVWNTQPESAGFSFGDLMLWSWVRREWAERQLVEATATLGFDRNGTFVGETNATNEEQMIAVRQIAAALDAKSSYTLGHSRRVEKHARKVAESLGLSAAETETLATAAALHDIGNISIPDHLLRKTGDLTIDERMSIEAHVLLGAMMVLKAGSEEVVDAIRHHHERWDGNGYPSGLRTDDIPQYARIIGIAEAYDAMTSTRPYRQGFGREHAIEVLRAESGSQFDTDLVEMFVATLPKPLSIVTRFPFLARFQHQAQELRLVFKRMGAVALSATASTIAIALILGSTILSNGVPDDAEGRDGSRRAAPIDRVLGNRIAAAPERITLSDYVPADGFAVSDGAALGSSTSESVLVADVGGASDGFSGGSDGPGENVDPSPIPDPGPGNGGGGGGNGGGDGDGNGNGGNGGGVDPGVGTGTNPPVVTPGGNGGGEGGGGQPTGPTPPPPPVVDNHPGKGNDKTDKGKPDSPGNSGNAPGHTGDKGKPENPGNGNGGGKPADPGSNGNGGGKPADPGSNGNGNSDGTPGNSGNAGGGDTSPGNSGGGNGNSDSAPGNSDKGGDTGGDTAPGNSDKGNGNSDSAPCNSDKDKGGDTGGSSVGAAAGASGNSGNGNGGGKDKDAAAPDTAPAASANGKGRDSE